ncbi:MAG: DUF2190 family protein [Alcaligenaceae bacterium]|nr:DUF2190 family protein [Alcaligenaceae bacterium SAGV5]MPS51258.1 DUF2190 family protein [Alcaligenaceae bacterium SAGV3]MPT57245.1 DUF2190 family protein [Alcaligenaceae bacterium]
MTKTYVQPGNVLDHKPSADVASGAVVVLGARIAIALSAIPANTIGSVQVSGVHRLAKKTGDTFAQGALVYWDNTANNLTSTATDNTLAGFAAAAAVSADTTMLVKLNA